MDMSNVLEKDVYRKNFSISKVLKLYNSDKVYVSVRFIVPNFGIDKEVLISVQEIKKSKFCQHIPEGFAIEGVPLNKQHLVISQEVNQKLSTEVPKLLLPQGFHRIEGRWLYVLGNHIINSKEASFATYNPTGIKLSQNVTKVTPNTYYDWCRLFCNQGEAQTTLFLSALTPYILPVVQDLNLPAKTVSSFVVGASGTGKTSYCELLCNVFGENRTTNLAAGKAEILTVLSEKIGCVLIDDLCDTCSDRERERKLMTLSEIIQMRSSSGAPVNLDNISFCVTGEFIPDCFSTINRVVVLNVETELNGESLTELQKNRICYEAFLIPFIRWICANAPALRTEVAELLQSGFFDYTSSHRGSSEYIGFPRVIASYKLLRITEFLISKFFSKYCDSERANKFGALLHKGIKKSIDDTLESIRNPCGTPPVAVALVEAYIENDRILAKSHTKYLEKKNKFLFREGSFLYFRGDHLAAFLSGKMEADISLKRLSAELTAANLLISFGGELSGRLPGKLRHRDGRRFYRISIDRFEDLAQSIQPCLFGHVKPLCEEW